MAVFAAISLTLAVTAVALSVDIGHQVYTERRLASVVDLAAQDASQAIGNQRNPAHNQLSDAQAFMQASATRNSFDYAAPDNALSIELGIADKTTKVFTPFPPGTSAAVLATANAVRVTGATPTNYAFMPGSPMSNKSSVVMIELKQQGGGGCASSCTGCVGSCSTCVSSCGYNYTDAHATMSLGSTLGSYSSSGSFLDPVLGGLLHGSVSLSAASYTGLADADVSLGEIWTSLGLNAGSPSSVNDTTVSVRDLIQAEIDVLNAKGDAASVAAATSLATLRAAADPSLQFTFSQILDLGVSGDASLNTTGSAAYATVDVLSLLAPAAEVANGHNAITFNLPVAVPGVLSGTISMAFVEAPVLATGPALQDGAGSWVTTAHTGQVRMAISLNLASGITVGTTSLPVRLPIYIEAGSASSQLTSISCQTINTNSSVVVAAQTHALAAYIGEVSPSAMTDVTHTPTPSAATIASGTVPIVGAVSVSGYGTQSITGASSTLTFNGPYDTRVQHVGATGITLNNLSSTGNFTVTPSGLSTATVASQLHTLTDPVLTQIETLVLKPLAATPLGVTIGGADVANPAADCLYGEIIGTT